MNIAAGGIGGAMVAPISSVIGASSGFAGLGNVTLDAYASAQAYGTYYYTYANIALNQKLSYFATGSVLSLGKAIGPTYAKYTPKPLMRYLYNKGVHSYFRNPTFNTNIDFIAPVINGLYGKTGAPYLDRPFGK